MAHYEEVNVHGYDEFCKAVSDWKGKDIFAYFSGDKDAQGKSWCPDCVTGNFIYFPPGIKVDNVTVRCLYFNFEQTWSRFLVMWPHVSKLFICVVVTWM